MKNKLEVSELWYNPYTDVLILIEKETDGLSVNWGVHDEAYVTSMIQMMGPGIWMGLGPFGFRLVGEFD